MAMERMLGGLSTRRYRTGLEPVGEAVEESSRSTSKSAVSRGVRGHDPDRADRPARQGPHRLGPGRVDDRRGVLRRAPVRGRAGHRHRPNQAPAGIGQGSTENTTVVKTLLTGLRDRGLDTTKPIM